MLDKIRVISGDSQVLAMLRHENVLVRLRAVQDVARGGNGDHNSLQLVIGCFADADAGVRSAAMRAVAKIAVSNGGLQLSVEDRGSLVALLEDRHPRVRRTTIQTIQQLHVNDVAKAYPRTSRAILDRVLGSREPDTSVRLAAATFVCLGTAHLVLHKLPEILMDYAMATERTSDSNREERLKQRLEEVCRWQTKCAAWAVTIRFIEQHLPKELLVLDVVDVLIAEHVGCGRLLAAAAKD